MKYFLPVLICAVLLSSCTMPIQSEHRVTEHVVDFTPYAEEGFLFTPEAYQGDYESIGYIIITIDPQFGKETYVNKKGRKVTRQVQERLKVSEALDIMHERAKTLGADAIMNLKFRSVPKSRRLYEIDSLEVEGLAIKRVGAFK